MLAQMSLKVKRIIDLNNSETLSLYDSMFFFPLFGDLDKLFQGEILFT